VREALQAAGVRLAERVSAGLVQRGFSGEVLASSGDCCVRVCSVARDVVAAELGSAGEVPSAPLENAARTAVSDVLGELTRRLGEALR
jgi:hypothetical protein